ncbi:MAG TPA: hypothetical protein VKU84_12075 [Stellaceae bacterium]|nr:hypothetical protein [Stellaceae bacterium]
MQIPLGQAPIPPNPVTPTAALPPAERAQTAAPARKVTASREGTETPTKGRSRERTAEGERDHRGHTLDLMV